MMKWKANVSLKYIFLLFPLPFFLPQKFMIPTVSKVDANNKFNIWFLPPQKISQLRKLEL